MYTTVICNHSNFYKVGYAFDYQQLTKETAMGIVSFL